MTDQETIRRRILSRIQKDPITKCWIYVGAWSEDGAARMWVGQKTYTIQRITAWLWLGVELWEKVYAYRICKSPACCNPSHVRVAATVAEAFADMRRRKLYNHRGHRKLRPAQRECIRFLIASGQTVKQIAADQKLNPVTVRRAGNYRPS